MVQPPGSDARVHAGTYKNTQAALCVYVPLRPQASEEHAHNPSKSPSDWVSPLEQYMTHLELKQHQRQVAAGSIRDPGRQVCICIFLWVYARSCLYMWCPTSWRRVCVVPHKLEASVCGAPQVGHVCVVLHELDMCQERGDNKMGCANVRPRAKLYS